MTGHEASSNPEIHAKMSPMTMIFGRDESLRLFEKSHGFFQTGEGSRRIPEDFFPSPKNRTKYIYGALPSDDSSEYTPTDAVRAVVYPDGSFNSQTHVITGSDCVTYDYDQIGEMTAMTDQNGTTHDYTYDGVGRLLTDTIASFGASLDSDAQYVNSIQYAYKVCGRLLSVTSYNDYSPNHPTEASVVNQVLYQYDTNGNLDAEYQAHGGPVNTATSLYVGYGCDDSTAVVNGVTTADTGWRPTTLEYPTTAGTATTRLLTYSYGDSGSSDDAINRLQSIGDGTETAGVPTTPDELASYAYLGVATIAKEDYTQLQIGLDYSGLDDSYSALDQFNRVVDQIWAGYGSNSSAGTLDGYAYGYNLQGNVGYRQNLTASTKALDQIFGYDDIEQLTSLAQGNLAVNGQGQPVLTDGIRRWVRAAWTSARVGRWTAWATGPGSVKRARRTPRRT